MLRIVETAVSVCDGRILDELVALSIIAAAEPFMSLFFERLWTPGVEKPETFPVLSREPSLEPDAPPPDSPPSLKKPLVFVPKAGVSTSFFL